MPGERATSGQRPNIILIMTDQQRYDTIRELGFPCMDTPHLDRLVTEGVAFTQTYVTAPSCAPARGSLFTGQFPHTTGIYENGDVWRHSWVELLAESGYHCVNVGKMHTTPFETPMGFHERYVVENKDRYLQGRYYFDEWDKALRARGLRKPGRATYRELPDYRERWGTFTWSLPEEMHPDFFVGDLATWWIQSYPPPEKPLFLQIGFPGPHPPYDPVARYAEPYLGRDLPLPQVTDSELAAQPPALRELREHNTEVDHDAIIHLLSPSKEQQQRLRAYYLANVTMIDERIGAILSALEEQGYLENAVVIFTSDHGDCLGDHGHIQKWTMYDQVVRVPMMVWAPGRFTGGRRVDDLVQHTDLGRTIVELAGLQPPAAMEANSLLPALEGVGSVARRYVFAEHSRDPILQGTAFMTMVRDRDWKLVHYVDSPAGQLFDLNADPEEVHNLWDDPAYAEKKRELLDVLLGWRVESDLHTRGWAETWR